MCYDPIVEEVERIKEAHARKYGFNIHKMVQALMEEERKRDSDVFRLPPDQPQKNIA